MRSTRLNKKVKLGILTGTWVLIVFVLAISAFSMEVSSVKGTIANGDVFHDFGKTILTVSPETAGSLTRDFEQTITITNKDVDLFYYVNPYYPKGLRYFNFYELVESTADIPNIIEDYTVLENGTKVWFQKESGTRKITVYTPFLLLKTFKTWGEQQQYFNTNGYFIKSGDTKKFKISYGTTDNTNKFDVRIWANTKNDWTCIEKETCTYSYTIDPTYNLTTGITSYWTLNETAGVTAYDSLFINNGTNSGSVTVNETGKIGTSFGFNGGHINLGNSSTLQFSNGNITISAWIKTNKSGVYQGIIGKQITGTYGWQLIIEPTNKPAMYLSSSACTGWGTTVVSPTAISTGIWYHIVGTSDGVTSILYINGTQVANDTSPVTSICYTANPALIGNMSSTSYMFGGNIDEVGLWSRALNYSEVNYLYNNYTGISFPFVTPSVDVGNFSVTTNTTFHTSIVETSSYNNYTINFTYGQNVSNISNLSFGIAYLPSRVTATQESNGTCGSNCTWQYFAVRNQRPPLNPTLYTTPYSMNWTYNTNLNNGTTWYNSTVNETQSVTMAYYPINVFIATPIIETVNTSWNCSYNITGGNSSDVSFLYLTTWNSTNLSGTQYINNSNQINSTFNYVIPFLNSTDNSKQFTLTPYLNITFNGTTVTRNGSAGGAILSATQLVYKMMLTNCSTNASVSNTTSNQFYVRDIITDALLNANTVFDYNVWLYSRYNTVNQSRSYSFSFTGNSSPQVCIYPNLLIANYTVDRTYNSSMTGYLSSSAIETGLTMTNTSSTTTIYLTNASAVQEVVITVTDQNDNQLTNYTVTAYLYSNGTYGLLDSEVSNLQGQVRFNLYIYDRQYQFRVYYPNGTVAKLSPETGGTTIISTTFTIRIDLVPQVTIANVIEMLGINHTLTFNATSGVVNLTFNDSSNLSCSTCLRIINMTNGNGSIVGLNCTTNHTGSLLYYLGTTNGTYVAQFIANRCEDGLYYLVDSITINRNVYQDFEREGILWSFLLIGTIASIGLYINPVLGIIFLELGIIACAWIGILPIGWETIVAIIAGGLFVAFLLGKEQ